MRGAIACFKSDKQLHYLKLKFMASDVARQRNFESLTCKLRNAHLKGN